MAHRIDGERPLQDRAVATRAALLDAALECLVERGYAATTTVEVARRAGVSRGAQVHHFPTKAELLTAAVRHLFEQRTAEFNSAFVGVAENADPVDRAIDLLWSMFQGPAFIAWAELWLASRTDAELRAAVVDMDRRFVEDSVSIFADVFRGDARVSPDVYKVGRDFVFAFMVGVALQRSVPQDHLQPARQLIDLLKELVGHALAP